MKEESTPLYHIFVVFFLLLFAPEVRAQNILVTNNNTEYTYQNIEGYTAFLNKTATDNAGALDKKIQKEYARIIAEKNAGLIKELNEHRFLFDAQVYPYLNAIFDQILEKNSLDKSQFHFFVSRTASVNASSYEDGTVICNLGLINIMENESQIAMVLCHELGHYLLKHVNSSIVSQLETYHSPEFLARVKQIKKQEYNSKKQLEELLTDDVFDRRKHNRSQEKAADSLGVVLFRNTAYNGAQVSHIFDLLAAAESDATTGVLQNFFKQENIPIDESWFKPAKKMSFGAPQKEVVDSLKTHPDCAVRKVTMDAGFKKQAKPGQDFLIADAKKLNDVKKTTLFEEAAYSKQDDNLSYYFYQLVQNNALYPSDGYIRSEIFATLLSLCGHQKNHTLHTVVSSQYIPDDDKDEYAMLLKLFDSIDLDTMADITTKYYNNNKTTINASAEAINNLKQLKN